MRKVVLESKRKHPRTLEEYYTVSKKLIKRYSAPGYTNRMLNDDECIGSIAYQLMRADWKYDKDRGRTQWSWRNFCGINAVKKWMGTDYKKRNRRKQVELVDSIFNNKHNVDYSTINNEDDDERQVEARRYAEFVIKNGNLSPLQEKCIRLYYMERIDSYEDVGKMMEPPISKQAVGQAINEGIEKLKRVAR